MPTASSIDVAGLDLSPEVLKRLVFVDKAKWKLEIDAAAAFYKSLTVGDDVPVPQQLLDVVSDIQAKLAA